MDFPVQPSAITHLSSVDPALGRLIRAAGAIRRSVVLDPFTALAESIVAQQLSSAAADTIWTRFSALVGEVTPKQVLSQTESALRACGLSFQKIGYIQNIANAFLANDLSDDFLRSANDADIIKALTDVKGIGRWTAEMFMIFCLGREDIFSYGDLGLRKGLAWLYGLPDEPALAFARAVNALWSPYNTTASLYLWEITLQNWFNQPLNQTLYPEFWGIPGDTDYFSSPIGTLKIVSTPEGLAEVSLSAASPERNSTCPLILETKKQLSEFFGKKRRVFDLPLSLEGTNIQKEVWAALQTLPFGQTANAGEIGSIIRQKASAQAVNATSIRNPLLILIPHHRLVRSDGRAKNDVQKWLLSFERETL